MASKNTVEIILAAKDKASRATQQAFGTVQSSAKAAFGAVKAASLAAAGALATVSGIVGKIGISHNAMMEQSEVAWKTLLGSAEDAQAMLKQISDFTKATPFDIENVDMMAKYMHNAGLEGEALFNQLMKNADVASAFSIPAAEAKEFTRQMSQVQQAGVAYTEDLNILQDRGIPIFKALSEVMNVQVKDVKKLASEGKITSDIYMESFNNIAQSVEGASEAQSKTFNGMISTLKDNIKIFAGEVTKGAFERIKGFLPPIISLIEQMSEAFENGGWKGVMEELLPPGIVNFITTSFQTIQDLFNSLKDTFIKNKSQIIGVFENIKSVILGLVDYYKSLFTGEGNIGQTFVKMFETIKSIALPILQDAISFIREKFAEIKKFWDENGAQIIEAVKNFWSVISAIFQALAPVILFIVKMVWDSVKGVISGALDVIMGLIKVFSGLFTGDFSKMWEGVKQIFMGAIEFVWNLINLMLYGRIITAIKSFATKGVTYFKDFWTKAVDIFKNLDTQIMGIITGFVSKVVGKLKGFYNEGARIFGTLRTFGASRIQALKDAVATIVQRMRTEAVEKITAMKTSITDRFGNILSSAKSKFTEIKNTIISPIQTAKEKVLGFIGDIKNALSNMMVKIKLPHFSVSNFSLNPKDWITKGMPKLAVDWYDKGGVFYGPQIIGVGEKRPEFVGALDDLRGIVGDVIRKENKSTPTTINVTLNYSGTGNAQDAYEMVDIIEKEFASRFLIKSRVKGIK